jgi:uncharacterized protein YjbI with pentapeptide repeats
MNEPHEATRDPDSARHYSAAPLRNLVIAGSVGVAAIGTVLFYYFAWLQTGEPWSFIGWVRRCTGQQLFDAARTTVTIVGILGLGGAALIAYRRQHTNERTLLTTIESQLTAARAVINASKGLELENERHRHDTGTALRGRYTDAAEQLGSESFAIRLAGVYALASLADDWRRFGNLKEQQVCVDLLCAYLRTDTLDRAEDATQERQIRNSVVGVIRDHTAEQSEPTPDGMAWVACRFDLSGADLTEANLAGVNLLQGATMINTDLECADLHGAVLPEAKLIDANLKGAKLTGTQLNNADLTGTDLTSARVLAHGHGYRRPRDEDATWGANLVDQDTDLSGAVLTGAVLQRAQLTRANLSCAALGGANLMGANLTSAELSGANLLGAKLFGADLTHVALSDEQKSQAIWDPAAGDGNAVSSAD